MKLILDGSPAQAGVQILLPVPPGPGLRRGTEGEP